MDHASEDSFWWSIDLEAAIPGVAGEMLMSLADCSGSIGAEFVTEGESPTLRAFYRSSEPLEYWFSVLNEIIKNPEGSFSGARICSYARVENRPWGTLHLEAFPPLPVGANLVVMAPWHRGKEPGGRLPLYIYPGSAFGTGYHESTQIALTFVERFVKKDASVIDIGAGSGVLFIAALKLGARSALARDLDPAVIAEIMRNMELNDLSPKLCNLAVGDLLKGIEEKADLLMANILLEPNLRLLSDVGRVLRPGGTAVFSGMTVKERPRFLSALSGSGLSLVAELTKNEWWGCAAGSK